MMLAATALLYPCVLAALSIGTGLLVERVSGPLEGALLLPVGAAGLIAVSQLSTYVYPLAPATPYLMAAVALGGYAVARHRVRTLAASVGRHAWLAVVSVVAYLIALAPVLVAGRPSFSSFMTLSDSAVHMIGADFLISHGQHYAGLDLRNSYGQFINGYYGASYPSGADTLFGGSARLIGLPLIWAFQPFNAFMLATAAGPAWTIARRMRLAPPLAALAALTAVLPALVYAYELFGSIKEITAVAMILTLGGLVAGHRRWLGVGVGAAGVAPFALVVAAGVSALGIAFGAWALAATGALALALAGEAMSGGGGLRPMAMPVLRRLALPAGAGALVLLVAAWPTWAHVTGSINIAQDIAQTSNPGNLHSPLRAIQVFGTWLGGSYKLNPPAAALAATRVLIAVAFVAAVVGAARLIRARAFGLAGWFALMLLAWLVVSQCVATWAGAKTLVLTSPAVVLLAWGGLGATRSIRSMSLAAVLALLLGGGALASDALQYRSSNLAPTARYDELASVGSRFAGRGPTLFTDFDEYSLYELRELDVGGPDFAFAPAALARAAGGYGQPVRLDRLAPATLAAYRLIVTRRDPSAARPPAAYRLVWSGSYYEVWSRRPGAAVALRHISLGGPPSRQCQAIGRLARALTPADRLVSAPAPEIVAVSLARAARPAGWGRQRGGLVMKRAGRLSQTFRLPVGGDWQVWIQGQLMPRVTLGVDGVQRAVISGQLSGNSLVPDTIGPVALRLSGGAHRVSIGRGGVSLEPGDAGSAVIDGVFLTPAGADAPNSLRRSTAQRWRTLCGARYEWIEVERP
jgi:hypothetical protein